MKSLFILCVCSHWVLSLKLSVYVCMYVCISWEACRYILFGTLLQVLQGAKTIEINKHTVLDVKIQVQMHSLDSWCYVTAFIFIFFFFFQFMGICLEMTPIWNPMQKLTTTTTRTKGGGVIIPWAFPFISSLAPSSVAAQIAHLSFSAHADAKGITQLIRQTSPGAVVFVHG